MRPVVPTTQSSAPDVPGADRAAAPAPLPPSVIAMTTAGAHESQTPHSDLVLRLSSHLVLPLDIVVNVVNGRKGTQVLTTLSRGWRLVHS